MNKHPVVDIVRRAGLDFGLDDEIPKYWHGGDAFKTRYFDALSLLFPEGEKFFIDCVRDYQAQVTDPELQIKVRDFTFQEAQHSRVHRRYNDRVGKQGVDVAKIEAKQKRMFAQARKLLPAKFTLAETAAAEHITAILAEFILNNTADLAAADPRIRAIYFWHAIEETEHKAVAFDVYKTVAKGGYCMRIAAMLAESILFPYFTFQLMRYMLHVDGVEHKGKVWAKGLWWLYGPRGVFVRMLPAYLRYYRPGFHPWQYPASNGFKRWLSNYADAAGDPIAATDRFVDTTTRAKYSAG